MDRVLLYRHGCGGVHTGCFLGVMNQTQAGRQAGMGQHFFGHGRMRWAVAPTQGCDRGAHGRQQSEGHLATVAPG